MSLHNVTEKIIEVCFAFLIVCLNISVLALLFSHFSAEYGEVMLSKTHMKELNQLEATEARVKELEGYLERYETITKRLYQIDGEKWILDPVYDDLVKLNQDIKKGRQQANGH